MKNRSISTWVFDLDNTLYPPQARLFDQIEAKMEAYMTREFGLELAAAKAMRTEFWHRYGTTLEGLVQVYGIDPDPFLEEVHDIDHAPLTPSQTVRDGLFALPGRRIIYTNGSRQHGRAVTAALGISDCFEEIYGIEDAGYAPKPKRAAFERVFETAGVVPETAAMIEDDPRNLLVPSELGMGTMLIGKDAGEDHIDVVAPSLEDGLNVLLGST